MSNMQIEVVANPVSTVPAANGRTYQVIDLAYKNKSFQDKLEGKKVMSFTNKDVFAALQKAQFGDIFEISRIKNDKGFWDWTAVTTSSGAERSPVAGNPGNGTTNSPVKGTVTPKSNYETAEERAARQVLIVRQSSISSAVDLAVANKVKDPQEVIKIAQTFEAYVFGMAVEEAPPAIEERSSDSSFFEDFENDLP